MVSKIKYFVALVALNLACLVQAQVFSNGTVTPNITAENPFIDGSTNFDMSVDPSSAGKGLVFPRTDLTQFTFNTAALDGVLFPTAFDGMLVYNIGTGSTLPGQGLTTNVEPGFYYFYNPNATADITNGSWLPLICGASTPNATVTTLECASAINLGVIYSGTSATAYTSIPYTGGNGGIYSAQTISSTGVTGLTATLMSGMVANGNGSIVLGITGTATSSGIASFELTVGGQTCTFDYTVLLGAEVSTLDCASATTNGTLYSGVIGSASATLPYTGGNGGVFPSQVISSTGVSGLTAILNPGSVASGNGSVILSISGTPSAAGTASFAISLGGQTCTFTIPVTLGATISTLNCAGAVNTGTLYSGMASTGSTSIAYTGGNGGAYPAQTISSTGVTGLTAALVAGSVASGNGTLTLAISGTPSAAGTASFAITLGGQTCTFNYTVVLGASVTNLDCAGVVNSGVFYSGSNGAGTSTISYTGGNGGAYPSQTISSIGVTGLTATLNSGTVASGNGTISLSISGTPSAGGTAYFNLTFGGQTCTFGYNVLLGATVSNLDCAGAVNTGTLYSGMASTGSTSIAYTAGNGGFYPSQTISSTGVTGLTATLVAGSVASGNGTLTLAISGTPSAAGTASFAITLGGQTCTFNYTVVLGATVTNIDCAGAVNTGTLYSGYASTGSTSITYTGGNGGFYPAQTITSTGVTGLTATLVAGSVASGNGTITLAISGTPSAAGTASFAITLGGQTCTFNYTVVLGATVTNLDCAGAVNTGTLYSGYASTGSTSITYTGGNGGFYPTQTISSTGVTGLTATLVAGSVASGNGTITLAVSGTPSAGGTASFAITFGGQTCTFAYNVLLAATVTNLNCAGAVNTGILYSGMASTGSTSIAYTGGNGGFYPAQTISSTGVTGLTATLVAGSVTSGNGTLTLAISGTPSAAGTASFAITLGGQTCTFNYTVVLGATVTNLDCTGAVNTGTLYSGYASTGSTSIAYTGGNGGAYPAQTISSTGVTGLTATLVAGSVASGNGTLTLAISGTPSAAGTASFAITFGGQSCTFNYTVVLGATVTNLNCAGAVNTGNLYAGIVSTGATTISYTGGNGGAYPAQTILSTGVTGLTATLTAGSLVSGNGSLVFTISGTPSSTGNATFIISVGSFSCSFVRTILSPQIAVGCNIAQIEADYGTTSNIAGAYGLTWITRNLGATIQATTSTVTTDAAAGCYFQFNRSQAYGNDLSDGVATVSPSWTITSINEIGNWIIENDPCRVQLGGTWRLPTAIEWSNIKQINTWNYGNDAFASVLKLHASGKLDATNGSLVNRGVWGFFLSSTANSTNNGSGLYVDFTNSTSIGAGPWISPKSEGLTARCVKDYVSVPLMFGSCNTYQTESNYGTVANVAGAPNLTWITRNLGATVQATNATDVNDAAAGCYFQFNGLQGYANDLADGASTVFPAWANTNIIQNSDWLISKDPCRNQLGGTWRIPTYTEWNNVDISGNWNNSTNIFGSQLKLHLAGVLQSTNGSLVSRGTYAGYWSSTQVTNQWGWVLISNASNATMDNTGGVGAKSYGLPVRCVKETVAIPPAPIIGCNSSQIESDYTLVSNLNGAIGLTWITRNLGSSALATNVNDQSDNAAGCYFQFNNAQGFENNISDGHTTVSPIWNVTTINANSDWILANDPCRIQLGTTWRIPTITEWSNIDAANGWSTESLVYASGIKLHDAGYLLSSTGALYERGENGYYWSSSQNSSTYGSAYFIGANLANVSNAIKANAFPVRCVKTYVPVGCVTNQTEAAYGQVSNLQGAPGLTWITRNLGATAQATSATDVSDAAAGCYFQFNRSQAYANDLADGIATVSPAWTITNISENSDWIISNDPCRIQLGGTWRIPTESEWIGVDNSYGWSNYTQAYASTLKLHTSGILDYSINGVLWGRGAAGYFWSSKSLGNTNASSLQILNVASQILSGGGSSKAYGFPVRCVKDFVPTPVNMIGCNTSQTEAAYSQVSNLPGAPGLTWITRNLGATAQATSATDASDAAVGCLFQFNRSQAHGVSGASISPVWDISVINENSNWVLTNDPCNLQLGNTWRIPTLTEFQNMITAGSWLNHFTTYSSPLKVHSAGYIDALGNFGGVGGIGRYWSSVQHNSFTPYQFGFILQVNSSSSTMGYESKNYGNTLRCVK